MISAGCKMPYKLGILPRALIKAFLNSQYNQHVLFGIDVASFALLRMNGNFSGKTDGPS